MASGQKWKTLDREGVLILWPISLPHDDAEDTNEQPYPAVENDCRQDSVAQPVPDPVEQEFQDANKENRWPCFFICRFLDEQPCACCIPLLTPFLLIACFHTALIQFSRTV